MNTYMAMGLFAFTVSLISLFRLTAERDFFRVRLMKRIFGRKIGLTLFFLANVATPFLVGLVFFCGGISADASVPSLIVDNPLPEIFQRVAPEADANAENDDQPFIS